ncbi:peptidoglycan DD-metalloendopeptidase family protein [Staphylococcus saprophyticus]|uniref:peptidoglycan DD-metalloendopeptidase family protein n=1 Tax=Staphylococcus saprophyticus TaxID=29385 RepID=UPI00085373C6|nr:peptidoglycan DD-metalloendopeptidase family protein [Staphylococcus saprophyticus]OEK41775.1 peptidase M23 [Staphylococcus saprophyticus]
MADFNLSAEVSMDVDPLKASKTTIERNLKAINKSLRNQRKEFKQNEVSAEALAKQETDLGRAVKLQEGLLKQRNKTLNDMQRQMKESNNVTDEQKLKLQNASRAVQQAENQLNNYENELKQTQTQQKLLGRTTDQVKNSLGQLRNEAKLTEMRFKQSEKSVSGYKNRLTELSHTMQKQKAHTDLLKGNLRELERAQQGNSREAKSLRNDIIKEAIAFQVLQGRIDETTDELKEYQRQQRLMGTATNAWVGARQQMDRIATTLRSLGELTQGVVGGVMTTHFSALVPILGSVVSLGAGLGGMLTAAAGGAIGMGGAFGIAGVAVKAFAGQATYALKMLEDGQLRVTKEVSAYQTALSGLKTSWEGLIAQNQAAIFNTMTNGINTAKYALTTLNPFLTKTASQIETASGKMLNWAKTSSVAKRSFDILNTQGPKIFQHLLNATQSFVNGSAALFNKLSPLYSWAARGFADMAKSFDDWANSVEGSKAINGFIEYTKANLPIVGNIFGNIFKGIISLFQAFSGHSHNVLLGIQDVTKGFAEWSEGLKKSDGFQQFVQYLETNGPKVWSLIKNITGTLWGLVKGMAPVGAAVLSMSNAFFKWTNTMTNAHPILGKILGILTAVGGVALLAAKPILLLRGALLGATGATKLLGNAGAIAAIKTKIAAAAMVLWTGASKAAALATRGLGLAIRFMSGPIGWVITVIGLLVAGIVHLWKTNDTFRNAVITIWNSIKAAAISVFGFLKPYIVGIWNGIKVATIIVWNAIKSTAITVWNGIKFAVQNPIQALKIALSAIWNGIKTAAIWVWNALKTGVVNIVKALVNGVKWYITTVKTVISTVFNAAKAIAIKIWTTIKNTVVNLAKGLWTGVKNAFTWLKNSVISIFNTVKNFAIKVWTTIKNTVVNLAKGLWNGVKNAFNWLKNSVVSIFNSVKNFAIKVWTTIKNSVVARAKSLWTGVKNAFTWLKNSVVSIFNNVKNFAIKVWTTIKNAVVSRAKSLWTGVKNMFTYLKNSVVSIFNNVKNFAIKVWTTIKNTVVSRAKSLWNGVKSMFTNLWNSVKSIFTKLKNWVVDTWTKIKNKVVGFAKSLWNGVKNHFNGLKTDATNIFNKVKDMAINKWDAIKGKIVGFATTIKDKVTGAFGKMRDTLEGIIDKIKGFISDMVDKVKGGLNKLIDGVNWVGGKLGMDKLPKIKLHTGTEHTNTTTNVVKNGKIARDTFATVGDKGKGNGPNGFRHEAIRYPNGKMAITPNKDTTTFLPQGSSVMNGAQTHAMLSSNNPTFSKGTLPRFASGTGGMFDILGNGKKPKKKKHENHNDAVSEKLGDLWGGTKKASGAIVEGGKKAVSATLGAAAKGKDWLKDKVGDVMDWIEKPGKLLNKILDGFGINMEGFGIPKAASLPFDMMKGMFGKLKKAATDTFKKWMEEQGGDGGYIKYLDNITTPYSPNGPPPGYAFSWPHPGIDLPYINEPVHSTISGKAYTKEMPGGFGHYIQVKGGALDVFYGHLSKWLVKNGQSVKPGTKLGISGNTGASTGPHLHYEMHKNGKPIDPVKWLKANSGGSQNKSASKWKSDIKRAAKQMKVNLSGKELNGIVSQIQRESNGNAGVTQGNIGDINNLRGTPAQGLLQYVPSTFKSYAVKGHKNIKNGYDQLLAFFNNSNWRRDLPYGKSGWGPSGSRRFATGTNNAPRGFAQVFEEGGEIMQMRGGETVIPNDVSIQAFKQIATSDIFSRTQSAVYDAISQYADQLREKQQTATREQQELQRLSRDNADIKEQNSILKESLNTMKAILGELTNTKVVNQEIRDKNYFPSSREMTKMNNENMALNAATQLMR